MTIEAIVALAFGLGVVAGIWFMCILVSGRPTEDERRRDDEAFLADQARMDEAESRVDIIGRNGNDGAHYSTESGQND